MQGETRYCEVVPDTFALGRPRIIVSIYLLFICFIITKLDVLARQIAHFRMNPLHLPKAALDVKQMR